MSLRAGTEGTPTQPAVARALERWSAERIEIRCRTLPSPDGVDRRCRFDLREGHDLERLLWPGTGSGNSTGLLQNSAVANRRFATVEPI